MSNSLSEASETQARHTAIDLFCGAGGLSYGLEAAGFDVRLGVDNDKHALATFDANHRAKALLADVREISGEALLAAAGLEELDLLAGGPCCQGFSTHGKRLADDPRNFLYVEFMRLVGEIRPATVVMENVKGLLLASKGAFKQEVFSRFNDLGYEVTAKLLLAADFGVPQKRERVIFLATRLDGNLDFPQPTHGPKTSPKVQSGELLPYVTLGEAISDLPVLGDHHLSEPVNYINGCELSDYQINMRSDSAEIWNHIAKPLSPLAFSIMSQLGQGEGLRSLSPDQLPERFSKMRRISDGSLRRDCTTLYHRLSTEEPAYTITCNFRNVSSGAFTHPTQNRSLTPREAARLQSFPDSFRFLSSAVPRQIGNAVPPLLGKVIGESVRTHLLENSLVFTS